MKLTCICIVICIFLTISLPRNSMAGPAVNKDGWLTKAVESLPFGGCFTAPFHAMGRNGREAVRSVVSGLAGGLTLVAGLGPLGVAMHKLAPIGVGVVSGMVVDIPFTYVKSSSQRVSTSTSSASIGRNLGGDVQYMAIKSLVLVNRWGFSLSADPNGNIISGNRNRDRNGWEGWVNIVSYFVLTVVLMISRINFSLCFKGDWIHRTWQTGLSVAESGQWVSRVGDRRQWKSDDYDEPPHARLGRLRTNSSQGLWRFHIAARQASQILSGVH